MMFGLIIDSIVSTHTRNLFHGRTQRSIRTLKRLHLSPCRLHKHTGRVLAVLLQD